MEKNVKSGERVTHITLDGTECAVHFSAEYRVFCVKSESTDILVSLKSGAIKGDDGTLICPSGGAVAYPHMRLLSTVYLTGSGDVTVFAGNEADTNPFKSAAQGGGEISAGGEMLTMNGLQGGVPFSEVVVSGENIAGRELTVTACGKNLLKYPYDNTTKTVNGITFTDNGDGSVTVNGTATAGVPFYFINKKEPTFPIDRTYFLSGCPVGGSDSTFDLFFASFNADGDIVDIYGDTGSGTVVNISENVTAINIYIRIREGVTVDNFVFRPMLELGSTETPYQPYGGADYTITPDSNPYTVPTEIYQQNGINTVCVTGEGEPKLSVTGVKTNAAVKKIWDKLNELTTAIIVSNGEI